MSFWNKQKHSQSCPFRDIELKSLHLLNRAFSPDVDKKNVSNIVFLACWSLLVCCWSYTRHPAAWNANKQPISKRSYGHMFPNANSWLVCKKTIKYFKIGGNKEAAEKVVWGPPSASLSLTLLSLPEFSFPLNLTKWNQNSPLSWLFFWNKESILPFNACRTSIKVDRKFLHGMKKEKALKSFLNPGIIFKGLTIRTYFHIVVKKPWLKRHGL